jgi:hypothetical protein
MSSLPKTSAISVFLGKVFLVSLDALRARSLALIAIRAALIAEHGYRALLVLAVLAVEVPSLEFEESAARGAAVLLESIFRFHLKPPCG